MAEYLLLRIAMIGVIIGMFALATIVWKMAHTAGIISINERSPEYDGLLNGRNPVGRFYPCVAAGKLVPAAGRFPGIKKNRS